MKRRPLSATLVALLMAAGLPGTTALGRTWTSADDSTKTFEGDLIEAADGKVTVRMANGRTLTFSLDKLSAADQEFIETEMAAREAAAKLADAAVPKAIDGKLVKLDGKRLRKHDLAADKGVPEFYLIYFSASW